MIFGKHINKYYIKYAYLLLLGAFALILVDYFQLLVPEIYRTVVNGMNDKVVTTDGVTRPFDMTFLLDEICLPLIKIILIMVSGRFLWRITLNLASSKLERDLRFDMFNHCKDLSQSYYQVNKVGDLMSLFTNDLETISDCFSDGVLFFLDAAFLGGMTLIKMIRMNPLLTAFCLIPMVFLFTASYMLGKFLSKKWEQRQEAFSLLSDFAQESFSGIAVIKAFAKEIVELNAFRRLNKKNEKINVEYTKMSTLLNICIVLFVESMVCVILGYGGYLVHTGVFNAGEMIEFIGYFTTIVWPIDAISMLIEMNARGRASLKRVSELIETPVDVCDKENVSEIPPIAGRIEFRNLTFSYPGSDRKVLQDVSFTIEPGEKVGIIGKTGSGKTTLVDLIMRTYNVEDNMLFVDGHDINSIPLAQLRESIAYVPQDNFLFSESIAANIAFSQEDTSDRDAISKAGAASCVHDDIMAFPDKYDTVLGERGVTVSGGQKQRISIARALMKEASIIILDDSVSAVDTKTEKTILNNLYQKTGNRTAILIAHRVSTIERMDKIIYIEDGRIVDVGTSDTLVARCPGYAQMVKLQSLEGPDSEMGGLQNETQSDAGGLQNETQSDAANDGKEDGR